MPKTDTKLGSEKAISSGTGFISMLECKTKIANQRTATGRKTYDKFSIHIPTALARDSAFPFKVGEEVIIKIDPKRKELVVSRGEREKVK